MTSPNANRPNLLLMLTDHLHSEITDTEQEIAILEKRVNERRDHLHTLRDTRAAAKMEEQVPPSEDTAP